MSRGRLRRQRGPAVVLALVVTGLVLLTALTPRTAAHAEALDPENPLPEGAQAVARVLRSHGVQVSVVRGAGALARAAVDGETTLMVTSTGNLGTTTAGRLRSRAVAAGALVLAAPGPAALRGLHLPLTRAGSSAVGTTASGCQDPLLGDLTAAPGPTVGYRGVRGARAVGCFRTGSAPHGPAAVVRVEGPTETYVLGGTDLLANRGMTRADNAALALRLLGRYPRLVWYVADVRDVPMGDAGPVAAQLPRALGPSLLLVAVAVVATMLWRGRRLGPLAVEPLPVVVKAVEATQGRGRLYRDARDREHAAGVLRRATARRLTQRLRLPDAAGPEELVALVAEATGRSADDVHDVLVARPVPDDTALTRLANELAALEKGSLHP